MGGGSWSEPAPGWAGRPLEPLLLAREDSRPRCPRHRLGPQRVRRAGLAALAGVESGSEGPGRPPSRGRERSSPRALRQNTRLSRNLETQGSRCHLRVTSSETPVIKCFFPAPSPGCGSPPFHGTGRIKPGEKHNCALHSHSASLLGSQGASRRGVLGLPPPRLAKDRGLGPRASVSTGLGPNRRVSWRGGGGTRYQSHPIPPLPICSPPMGMKP